MKYIINYNEQGKILGFTQGKDGLNIEVSNATYIEAQKYNKIIVDGDNITFDKVDWRTLEEIDEAHNADILSQISAKEYELIRPMRELLSTTSSSESKEFAQGKIDEIELEIHRLRGELNGNS